MKLRRANLDDVSLIYQFIQQKAEFDRSVGAYFGSIQTDEAKIRATLFNQNPYAYVLLAEDDRDSVGFALYGFGYSSFSGQPSIWLDDLYVRQNKRSQGAGTLLMKQLQQIAREHNCTHLAWTADARNTRGVQFYSRLGATISERKQNRCFFQWTY